MQRLEAQFPLARWPACASFSTARQPRVGYAASVTLFEDDRGLLDAFRRGEREALRRVYVRYFDDVLGLLRRGFVLGGPPPVSVAGLSDEGSALELLQETFVRAFGERARASYDGLRPYRPFLLRIARNLRIDQLRASGRELSVGQIEDEHFPSPSDAEPLDAEHEADWAVRSAATREYLAGLDAETQRYVQLRFVQELSQADVAAQLGVTRRRVRSLEDEVQKGLLRFLRARGL